MTSVPAFLEARRSIRAFRPEPIDPDVVDALVAEKHIPKTRSETFDVARRWGAPPLFRLDRGAVPFFGTRAYGVHLNGYRRDGSGLALWVGHRAADKRVAPNKLDNLVAGHGTAVRDINRYVHCFPCRHFRVIDSGILVRKRSKAQAIPKGVQGLSIKIAVRSLGHRVVLEGRELVD